MLYQFYVFSGGMSDYLNFITIYFYYYSIRYLLLYYFTYYTSIIIILIIILLYNLNKFGKSIACLLREML